MCSSGAWTDWAWTKSQALGCLATWCPIGLTPVVWAHRLRTFDKQRSLDPAEPDHGARRCGSNLGELRVGRADGLRRWLVPAIPLKGREEGRPTRFSSTALASALVLARVTATPTRATRVYSWKSLGTSPSGRITSRISAACTAPRKPPLAFSGCAVT